MKSRSSIARVYCAAGVVSLGLCATSRAALPSIVFDLRVHDTGGKDATVHSFGDSVVLDLYVHLNGLDADPTNDVIQSGSGSVRSSTGGLAGDLLGLTPPVPFNASGSSTGTQADLDSDGDLDIGNNGTSGIGVYFFRTASIPAVQPSDGFFVGQMRFTARTVTAATTQITYTNRTVNPGLLAWMDNTGSPISPTNSTISYLSPVTIHGDPVLSTVDYIDGTYSTHLSISKPTEVTAGKTLSITKGIDIAATASLVGTASNTSAWINDTTSGNFGGTLNFGPMSIASSASGTFTQAAGYSNISSITLASGNAVAPATLQVSGGRIDAASVTANASASAIHQNGGEATYGALTLNNGASADLSAGTMIIANQGTVGTSGDGTLTVSGGTCNFNGLSSLGGTSGKGLVRITGGTLSLAYAIFNFNSIPNSRVEQDGGTFYYGGAVNVVTDATTGVQNFAFTGGTATGGSFIVNGYVDSFYNKNYVPADTVFVQTAGNIIAANSVGVWHATKLARYDLRGGTVSTDFLHVGHDSFNDQTQKWTYLPGEWIQSGGEITVGSLVIDKVALFRMSGGTVRATKSVKLTGTMDLTGAPVSLTLDKNTFGDFAKGTLTGANNATFYGGVGSIMNFAAGFDPFTQIGSIQTQGLIHINGEPLAIPPSKSVGGSGTIEGDVTNSGVVSPGNSPGEIDIVGNYTQSAAAALVMEIAGTASDKFDLVTVSGTASLAGTLDVALLDDFVPSASDTFTIFTAGNISGTFGNAIAHVDFAGGRFDVTYTPTAVTLSNFVAVPEPAGLALLAAGAATLARRRRRK